MKENSNDPRVDQQSRSVVITTFTRGDCPSVNPHFQNLSRRNNFQLGIVITTGGTVGHTEGIIVDT